jgi:hypothetical protein
LSKLKLGLFKKVKSNFKYIGYILGKKRKMVLQIPWTYIFLSYWLFCIILFYKFNRKPSIKLITRFGSKVYIIVLFLYIAALIFHIIAEIIQNKYIISFFLYSLSIVLDVSATVIFVWYCFKGGGLLLGLPLLILKYGSQGASTFIEEHIGKAIFKKNN